MRRIGSKPIRISFNVSGVELSRHGYVKKLVNMSYDFNLPAVSGIGYQQIGKFLRDEMTLTAAIRRIKFETHRFVRHQYGWFRLKDDRIQWFDMQNRGAESEIMALLAEFVAENNAGRY